MNISIKKAITLVANVIGGLVVVNIGLAMLPSILGSIWGIFNVYVWIAAPIILLQANKKEVKKP